MALKEIMSFSLSSLSSYQHSTKDTISVPPQVQQKHFEEAFSKVTPSVSDKVNEAIHYYTLVTIVAIYKVH